MGTRALVLSRVLKHHRQILEGPRSIAHFALISTPATRVNFKPVLLVLPERGRRFIYVPYDTWSRYLSTFVKQKSHYEVLNVSRDASTEEIRQAFITLSKKWHPDTNTSNDPSKPKASHQKFVQINEAYSVLCKPLSRRDYDLSLDADRYVSRQMSAAASRTHSYGYSPHAGPYYHYREHVYDETYWAGEAYRGSDGKLNVLVNFYMIMACVTIGAVTFILQYMYSMPNPKHQHLRNNLTMEDIEKHELIMQSEQDGTTMYYYAVPKKDSKKFDIVVMQKSDGSGAGDHKMHEVTKSPASH